MKNRYKLSINLNLNETETIEYLINNAAEKLKKNLLALQGKIKFSEDYDYKKSRD